MFARRPFKRPGTSSREKEKMNIEQLAAWTRLKSKSALFALIGLILSPLAVVAHAPVSSAESVHFYAPFDYEKWRRDHPRPAGKRLANLNVGEPRTVRMIYFLPNDRPYRQEVVDEMKAMMRRVQTFFAEQMQAHGYGNTTFRFETDAQGQPLVHRVDGQHPESHYNENDTNKEVLDEIYFGEGPLQFDVLANDYLVVIDNSTDIVDGAGGTNMDFGKRGGMSLVPSTLHFGTVAHELGHTFSLLHDFRDDAYIMSYGFDNRPRLSACAAGFLSVHPYFNSRVSLKNEKITLHEDTSRSESYTGNPFTAELISSPNYPAGSTKVSIRLKLSDLDGLHYMSLIEEGVVVCRELAGKKDTVVEFDYDISTPFYLDVPGRRVVVHVVDRDGGVGYWSFNLAEISPYQIATLRHTGEVRAVSFSPDGTLLATAGGGDTVLLWDTASWQQVATLKQEWISSISFSPDGTLLASGGGDTVLLWDTASWQQVATLRHKDEVKEVSFSPDGTLLAIITGRGYPGTMVWLWDVASRQQTASLRYTGNSEQWASAVSFSPDGTLLATAGGGDTVLLWDTASWQQVATLRHTGNVNWRSDRVRAVSFSPDGTLLASGGTDGTVWLWDVASRQQTAVFTNPRATGSVSFSPDGTLLATAGAEIGLWDVASRQQTDALQVGGDDVGSVSFSPDGTLLASGQNDGTIGLWDISEWTQASGQVITADEEETKEEEVPTGEEEETTDEQEETIDEQATPHILTKVSGDGQGGQTSERLAKPFVVSVLDQNESAFAGAVVSFSVTAGGGTLSAITATTDANGRARSTLTLGSEPGTNTVAVTVAGLAAVTFTATAITPHSLTKVSGDGQQGTVGERLAKPFVVSVLDQNGSAFAGAVVSFSVTAAGGTLSATTDTTDASGRARSTLTLGSDEETNTVTAAVAGLGAVTFTAIAITPHSLTKVSGDGQQGTVGERLAKPFVVSVLDQNGSAFAGAVVSFSVTAGGGTLSATTDTTDANGRAATRLTLGSDEETNTVTATVAGLDSVAFTATAITPHSLTKVSGDGQQGLTGAQLAAPFLVLVLDEEDGAIAGAVVTFTVTGGGGTMSSNTAITNTSRPSRQNADAGRRAGNQHR